MIRRILRLAVRVAVLCQGWPVRCTGFFVAVRMVAGCVCRCEGGAAVVLLVHSVCFFGTFLHILFMMSGGMAVLPFFVVCFLLGSLLIGVGYAG